MPEHRFNASNQFLFMDRVVTLHRQHLVRIEGGHFRGIPVFPLGKYTTDPVSTGIGHHQNRIHIMSIFMGTRLCGSIGLHSLKRTLLGEAPFNRLRFSTHLSQHTQRYADLTYISSARYPTDPVKLCRVHSSSEPSSSRRGQLSPDPYGFRRQCQHGPRSSANGNMPKNTIHIGHWRRQFPSAFIVLTQVHKNMQP